MAEQLYKALIGAKNRTKAFFTSLLTKWLEDLFILIGLLFVVLTTYHLSIIIANYLTGFIFLLLGFIFARK